MRDCNRCIWCKDVLFYNDTGKVIVCEHEAEIKHYDQHEAITCKYFEDVSDVKNEMNKKILEAQNHARYLINCRRKECEK